MWLKLKIKQQFSHNFKIFSTFIFLYREFSKKKQNNCLSSKIIEVVLFVVHPCCLALFKMFVVLFEFKFLEFDFKFEFVWVSLEKKNLLSAQSSNPARFPFLFPSSPVAQTLAHSSSLSRPVHAPAQPAAPRSLCSPTHGARVSSPSPSSCRAGTPLSPGAARAGAAFLARTPRAPGRPLFKVPQTSPWMSHPEIFEFKDVIKIKNKTEIFS